MKTALLITALALSPLAFTGCQTAPSSDADRATLTAQTDATLVAFKNADSSLEGVLKGSAGYAVFPNIGRGGLIAGGAFGRGQVFTGSGERIGFASVSQATIGLQAGVQSFEQIVIFRTPQALDAFKNNRFEFNANASAVAINSGAAASARYNNDVAVFVRTTGGLMAELSVGGQRFTFKAY